MLIFQAPSCEWLIKEVRVYLTTACGFDTWLTVVRPRQVEEVQTVDAEHIDQNFAEMVEAIEDLAEMVEEPSRVRPPSFRLLETHLHGPA